MDAVGDFRLFAAVKQTSLLVFPMRAETILAIQTRLLTNWPRATVRGTHTRTHCFSFIIIFQYFGSGIGRRCGVKHDVKNNERLWKANNITEDGEEILSLNGSHTRIYNIHSAGYDIRSGESTIAINMWPRMKPRQPISYYYCCTFFPPECRRQWPQKYSKPNKQTSEHVYRQQVWR